jgi:hypothetical protein
VAEEETRLGTAFSGLVDASERQQRVISAQRSQVSKLLDVQDVRKLADTDTELNAAIARHAQRLTAADQAAATWQSELAAATKQWEASLAELASLHGDLDAD